MRIADFSKLLQSDFKQLSEILADGIFAAFLLGFDSAREEVQSLKSKAQKADYSQCSYNNYVNYTHSFDFADGVKLVEDAGLLQLRFDVPPKEAIDYFQRKKILPAKEFYALGGEARQAAFTVGGIYETDILKAFRQEIETALTDGIAQGKVLDNFKNILAGAGHKELGDFHLETVLSFSYLENLIRLKLKESYFCGIAGLKRVSFEHRRKIIC